MNGTSYQMVATTTAGRKLIASRDRAMRAVPRVRGHLADDLRAERPYGRCERPLRLPEGMDAAWITVRYDQVVLEAVIPAMRSRA